MRMQARKSLALIYHILTESVLVPVMSQTRHPNPTPSLRAKRGNLLLAMAQGRGNGSKRLPRLAVKKVHVPPGDCHHFQPMARLIRTGRCVGNGGCTRARETPGCGDSGKAPVSDTRKCCRPLALDGNGSQSPGGFLPRIAAVAGLRLASNSRANRPSHFSDSHWSFRTLAVAMRRGPARGPRHPRRQAPALPQDKHPRPRECPGTA